MSQPLPGRHVAPPDAELVVVTRRVRTAAGLVDRVENVHRGRLALLGADGALLLRAGDVSAPLLPRSSAKPFQALGMLTAGWRPSSQQGLALACGSHSGEPAHTDVVVAELAAVGLTPSALRCVADLPYGAAARQVWQAGGRVAEPLAMNCSGKHAAMLATCVQLGWSTHDYLDPQHPLQVHLRAELGRLTELPAPELLARELPARELLARELPAPELPGVATDGCGAPLFEVPLLGLALATYRLVAAVAGPELEITAAMRANPWAVGGTGRECTRLMAGVPGLVLKEGADGVLIAGIAGAGAFVLTITDGSIPALWPIAGALLRELNVDDPPIDVVAPAVIGGGQPVGSWVVTMSGLTPSR